MSVSQYFLYLQQANCVCLCVYVCICVYACVSACMCTVCLHLCAHVYVLSRQVTKSDLEQRHPQLEDIFTLAQNIKNKTSNLDVRTSITEKCTCSRKFT